MGNMKTKTYYRLPAGIQDMLPAECYNLQRIKRILDDRFVLAGCNCVQSAALEFYDTYAEIKNRIPQKRMFKLTDSDGSLLVLRPDMTLALTRMAATRMDRPDGKYYYFSNVWHYEKTGGLSIREVYQAGVEFLGVSNAFSDAQTIAFAVECLREIGLKDFIIDIGHVGFFKGILEGCDLPEETLEEVRLLVNAKDSVAAQKLLLRSGADVRAADALVALPTLFGGEKALRRAERYAWNDTARGAVQHLEKVYRLLKEFGVEKYVSFDLGTVKDLSYYSGIVFTGLTKSIGSAVLSGGRYDNLADDFGKHVPAVGFAMGLKRILIALERQGDLLPVPDADVMIVAEEGYEAAAYAEYRELAGRGVRADLFAGTADEARALCGEKTRLLSAGAGGVKEI